MGLAKSRLLRGIVVLGHIVIGIAETDRQGAVGVIGAELLHPIANVAQLQPFNDTPRKWDQDPEGECALEGGHGKPVCHTSSKGTARPNHPLSMTVPSHHLRSHSSSK